MNNNIDKFKFYLIGMINGISKDDLIYMIKEDEAIILLEYDLPPYLSFVKDIIIEHKEEILKNITYENLIKYADEFKADIAGIVRHPKAKKWFERLLKQVRFIIENAHLSPQAMRAKFVSIIQAEQKRRIDEEKEMQELLDQKDIDCELEELSKQDEIKEIINPTNPKPNEELKSEEIKKKKKDFPDEYGLFFNPHI